MADFLGDELFPVLGFPVYVVVVFVDVAFGDEVVTFPETLVSAFGSFAVLDEVVERSLELGEGAVVVAVEVFLPDRGVETSLASAGDGQLRIGDDEPGKRLLRADSHVAASCDLWVVAAPSAPSTVRSVAHPIASSESRHRGDGSGSAAAAAHQSLTPARG
jgi:hypothetical protein